MSYKVISVKVTHIPTNTVFTGYMSTGFTDFRSKIYKFSEGEGSLDLYKYFFEERNSLSDLFTLGVDIGPRSSVEITGVSTFDDIVVCTTYPVTYNC